MWTLLAIEFSTFFTALGPVLAVIISGAFTYLGVRLNHRAKEKDQKLVAQSQEFDAIKVGQGYFKDALDDARAQLIELKKENAQLETDMRQLEMQNKELQENNRRLEVLIMTNERQMSALESQLQRLKDQIP